MITEKTIITVTRDDPNAKIFKEECTNENGWTKEECTVSVSYTHFKYLGLEVKNERNS